MPASAAGMASDVAQALKLRLPKTPIDAIRCDRLGPWCEVVSGDTLFYIDETARSLFVGRLYDMEERRDVTAARLLELKPDLLAAGAALGRGTHVALHWMADVPGSRRAALSQQCAEAAGLVFAVAVLIVGGLRLVLVTAQIGPQSAALGIPLAAIYTALPVAGVAIALRSAANLWAARHSATGSSS